MDFPMPLLQPVTSAVFPFRLKRFCHKELMNSSLPLPVSPETLILHPGLWREKVNDGPSAIGRGPI